MSSQTPQIRISTEKLKGYATARLAMDLKRSNGYRDKVSADSSKHLPEAAKDVFLRHKTGRTMPLARLVELMGEQATAAIDDAAGVGRSAKWVSAKEAKTLPPHIKAIHDELRERRIHASAEEGALAEPFPRGLVSPDYFGRFVAMQSKRATESLIESAEVRPRLAALVDAVKAAGGQLQVGDTTVHAVGDDGIRLEGRRVSLYAKDGTKLVFHRDNEAIAVGWQAPPIDLGDPEPSASLMMHRYDLSHRLGDPTGRVSHQLAGTSLEDVQARLGAGRNRSEAQQLFDRVGGSDLGTLGRVIELLDTHCGNAGANERAVAIAKRGVDAAYEKNLGRFIKGSGIIKGLREIEAAYRAAGKPLLLCDDDINVRVEKRWVRHYTDDNDTPQSNTLRSGRQDLLIVENSFGSLGYAIPVAALRKGDLDLVVAHGENEWSRINVTRGGNVRNAGALDALLAVVGDIDVVIQNAEDQ